MGPIGCPETSVNNYHTTPRNITEERRAHQHRGGSLKYILFVKKVQLVKITYNKYYIHAYALYLACINEVWAPRHCSSEFTVVYLQ